MRLPRVGLLRKAERAGDQIKVPPSPTLGAVTLLRQTLKQADEDNVSVFAAGLAYRGLFATFLALLFALSLLGLFSATEFVVRLLDRVSLVIPGPVMDLLRERLPNGEEGAGARRAFTLGAAVSILAALWGVAGAFRSVMQAMNVMYKVHESRPAWKRYAISVGLSLTVAALTGVASVLVVFGGPIGERVAGTVGLGRAFRWAWLVAQWPILVLFVLLAFALVYYYAPDVEQEFRFVSPGALIGLILWLLFTLLFLLFVNSFGVYNRVYGALAGVAIHMLYMYYLSYILLLGAEINQVVEENTPGGKREGEKVPGQRQHRWHWR